MYSSPNNLPDYLMAYEKISTPKTLLSYGIFRLHLRPLIGTIAQVVEQWTENPCVPGSNPGGTTLDKRTANSSLVLFLAPFDHDLS